jgi:uncharacterized protein YkwD
MHHTRALAVLFFFAALPAVADGPFLPGSEITRDSVLQYMNYYRGVHGIGPLREDSRLDQAASDRMNDMEELAYFAHFSPEGRSPFSWLTERGYEYQSAGENLARGFETTQILVESWMESPGHRANILSLNFEDVGIAIIDGAPTGRSVGKSIVVLFAHTRS